MVHVKNYETLCKFVKLMQRKLQTPFRTRCRPILWHLPLPESIKQDLTT